MALTDSFPTHSSAVRAVVVVPRSGYINRLQAIASSSMLANELGAEFQVCWEEQSVASAPAKTLFDVGFVAEQFISVSDFSKKFGYPCSDVPRYLNQSHGVISLAGYEHGEQHFMDELKSWIQSLTSPYTLLISAGGNFSWDTPERAVRSRGAWYKDLVFADHIEIPARNAISLHAPYLGVHLRFTDRSHETPLNNEIESAIVKQVAKTGLTSIFIASDSPSQRDKWVMRLQDTGLNPWFIDPASLDRSSEQAGVAAMIDWKILGHAYSSVYFAASSFGHEAAVMAGSIERSEALPGHPIRRWQSRGKQLASALINYPRNHWSR
jgi:hypothetical protein